MMLLARTYHVEWVVAGAVGGLLAWLLPRLWVRRRGMVSWYSYRACCFTWWLLYYLIVGYNTLKVLMYFWYISGRFVYASGKAAFVLGFIVSLGPRLFSYYMPWPYLVPCGCSKLD